MLQQTQVKTVLQYFDDFIRTFPTLEALAKADEDLVLRKWAGLGYYRRAKFLHQTAKRVSEDHENVFPDSIQELVQLPGIGKSTAGAIRSLGFDRRGVVLDGNIQRILTRFHGLEAEGSRRVSQKHLWELAESHHPRSQHAKYTQAMMDFGATWCTKRNPRCDVCPLNGRCDALRRNKVTELPTAVNRIKPKTQHIYFLLIQDSNGYQLLERRPANGLWPSMWLPVEVSLKDSTQDVLEEHGIPATCVVSERALDNLEHILTHLRLQVHSRIIHLRMHHQEFVARPTIRWYGSSNHEEFALPALATKLLNSIKG